VTDVLHVTTPAAWEAAQATGELRPESLTTEGFVHCSTRGQLAGTLARHFAGTGELLVLVLDVARVSSLLRWEESRPGEEYPHLYGPLPVDAVVSTEPAGPVPPA
jgi:uncharacterized protein (DUF952 family)